MMKTAFNFSWKGFFLREIFQFMFWSFGHVGERLDKMAEANFKIHDITSRIKKINILPVNTASKSNHNENWSNFNMKNIFIEKHTEHVVEKLDPDPFLKYQHSAHLWINSQTSLSSDVKIDELKTTIL